MNAPHPTRIVRFHLLAVLLGVSIPFAVEDLVRDFSTSMLLAEIAFLLTALNFFHGKVVTLEDEDYNDALTDRPVLALLDYGLNLLVILNFVFMAFFLDKPGRLIIFNIALRTIDTILVFVVRSALPREAIRKAQTTWFLINVGAILVFLIFAWAFWPPSEHHLAISMVFLFVILADILIDYSINRKIYFSMADSWDDMASFWDWLQGEDGDLYRQAIIVPAILEAANPCQSKRILDAGCGNGCIARALAKQGAIVVGVDSSARHLENARAYSAEGVSYQLVDLNTTTAKIEGQPFDTAVFCFTLQDCDSLETPLRLAADHLAPGGRVVAVFENDISFESLGQHSTIRRWLGSDKLAGRGRRQLIIWEPRKIRSLRVASQPGIYELETDSSASFKTITRHWSAVAYQEAAIRVGLCVVEVNEHLGVQPKHEQYPAAASYLAAYGRRPRFGMMVFEKKAAEEEVVKSKDVD